LDISDVGTLKGFLSADYADSTEETQKKGGACWGLPRFSRILDFQESNARRVVAVHGVIGGNRRTLGSLGRKDNYSWGGFGIGSESETSSKE